LFHVNIGSIFRVIIGFMAALPEEGKAAHQAGLSNPSDLQDE